MAKGWLLAAAAALILLGAACGAGGGSDDGEATRDPEDFREFAEQIARAAEEGNVAFFGSRVLGDHRTCTEADVEAARGPNAPPEPVCTEVGLEYDAVVVTNYGASGATLTADALIRDIQTFFEDAIPTAEDKYGPGGVRLYATAVPQGSREEGKVIHTAILTGLYNFIGLNARYVRALDFEHTDGQWRIRSETTASFPTAVDLLEPVSALFLYDDWTRFGQ